VPGESHEPFAPPLPFEARPEDEPLDDFVPPPVRRRFQDRTWLHLLLFLLTVLTTTWVGAGHYLGFTADFAEIETIPPVLTLVAKGFWYSGTILLILGAHELGHYFACRYYQVDASLPFFIPAWGILTGTFGAFIRIREPIPSKRMLFDIGIAGPIAGFLFAVPALLVGVAMSRVAVVPPDFPGLELGEPLLFRAVSWAIWGAIPDGSSLNLHPMGFAAWFGLLATALNLFPVGQLDGGHIAYAVLGPRSTIVTLVMVAVAVGLTVFFSLSWAVWTVLLVVMLVMFGPRHPRTLDEDLPLDDTRRWLAVFAVIMFVLCFTLSPIQLSEAVRSR
jgi:membrane-associated protease RseP (regulator of RpoE activity)